jgi:hypothetical protein
MLSVQLTAPTTGWVAVGFDPDSIMLGANILIGYVASSTTFIRDDFGTHMTSHNADTLLGGTDDVTIDGGQEAGGETTIEFTIPMNSGDMYDTVLEPGNIYPVIMAMGVGDDFTSMHTMAVMAEIGIWDLSLESGTWAEVKSISF